ncbi:MAG TPA: C25 family cysteine peptidase, partial [bacterium]|nr:C25 family cysteine peptidase [bacterium]
WNLDGDGNFGEYDGDRGTGGVDFAPEVYVGRIPVYSSDYSTLDNILDKIITYEIGAGDISWRNKMLLPMAISNYYNEDSHGYPRSDGRNLPKRVIENYLVAKGFSYFVLYEKAGVDPVPDSADYDNPSHLGISTSNVINEWNNNYGCVFWWGHGSDTGAYRKYWNSDDGDDVPESSEMTWTTFFASGNCSSLNNAKPSLVYQCSCDNGHPETSNNLGYSLLKNGAIGTVSASRTSWYGAGTWEPWISYADNAGIGYYFFKKIVESNKPFGEALYVAKSECGDSWEGPSWMNKMDFNLYGDPSLKLVFSVSPALNVEPTSLDFGMEEETKTINIRNTGGGALHWNIGPVTYNEGSGWITSITPSSDSTTTETDIVTVTVSRTGLAGGTYTATIPVLSDGGNQDVSVSVRKKSPPDKPTNISPANGATGVSLTPTLTASAFSDPDGDTMLLARWRIKEEGVVIWQSSNQATSISVPSGVLQYNTTYTWQVQYENTYGYASEWSDETSFITRDRPYTPPVRPVNISPTNMATGVSLTPLLQASPFSDPDGDTMADSHWRIRGETGTYEAAAIWENTSAGAVTSILVTTPLSEGTRYFWQVRYKDSSGSWSNWSEESSFTTITSSGDEGDGGGGGGG